MGKDRTVDPARDRIYDVAGRDDHFALAGKTQADDIVARHEVFGGRSVGLDLYNAMPSAMTSGNIHIA